MPLYTFENTETGEVADYTIKMANLHQFKADHPELRQVYDAQSSGKLVTSIMGGQGTKPDAGFREVLKKIKKGNPRSRVNTFD